jgi:glucans biosynthesis protein C
VAQTRVPSKDRLFFLDWLRIAAVIVLVLYHVGMYYVRWDFHVKSPFSSAALEPWMKLTEPWRMDLLFLVSGAATAMMLKSGATLAVLKKRSKFLLLPLLCGVVLIVPPQSYFEVIQKHAFTGSYWQFLGLYFSGYHGFCGSKSCLILPTWNHLWFLPYLWVYTLLVWCLVKFSPGRFVADYRTTSTKRSSAAWLLLPVVFIFILRLSLWKRFPSSHALVDDWFNHAMYFGMFLVGVFFALHSAMWDSLCKWRWVALLAAVASWATLMLVRPSGSTAHLLIAVQQWGAIVAAIGFAKHLLNRDHPWRSRLSEAVFPVYIFHQTLIIVSSQWLLPFKLQPEPEGLILVLLTLVLSYAGYEVVRRIHSLRPWFGLRS